ncbi:MAG: DUF5060 domain-containing protein [Bacteroidota bacterium]
MTILTAMVLLCAPLFSQPAINDQIVTQDINKFEKVEFDINIQSEFENPYDSRDIQLDMMITSPSGEDLVLPCYFDHKSDAGSLWKARFAPAETGKYLYHFRLTKGGHVAENSGEKSFTSKDSSNEGFLRTNNYWTLKFDSGKLFRGIGENICWDPRGSEERKFTYEYLLPKVSFSGANFMRVWMHQGSLPSEWTLPRTRRNEATPVEPEPVNRFDEILDLAKENGIYVMIAMDVHGMYMEESSWSRQAFNSVNGGPAKTPTEFFTLEESRIKYKNKLRYFVARWGYSTNVAFWEFFNEVDNAAFTRSPRDSVLIPLDKVAEWHDIMSTYLKSIDPYKHLVTTSVSHREIPGMWDLDNMDLNQKHIYKRTTRMRPETIEEAYKHQKPFAIGEFGYEWDWNLNFSTMAVEKVYDYKCGLWYGMFTPTPVLPMSWWWEFFDDRGVTQYFKGVREISDQMLAAGNGSFDTVSVSGNVVETYAVKCGKNYYVYVLNDSNCDVKTGITLDHITDSNFTYSVKTYIPEIFNYNDIGNIKVENGLMIVKDIYLRSKDEMVLIISRAE